MVIRLYLRHLSLAGLVFILFLSQAAPAQAPSPYPDGWSDPVCQDTDGGRDFDIRGTVTDVAGSVWTDRCVSPTILYEGYCGGLEETGVARMHQYCPMGCAFGRCKANRTDFKRPEYATTTTATTSTTTTIPDIAGIYCADTDRGFNTSVKGDILINGRKKWGDSCISGSQLQEGYCHKRGARYYDIKTVPCEHGCFAGACSDEGGPSIDWSAAESRSFQAPKTTVPPRPTTTLPPCTDSDGGADEAVRGRVTGRGAVFDDFCISPSMLTEGFCDLKQTDRIGHVKVYCDYGCQRGACLPKQIRYIDEEEADTTIWAGHTPTTVTSTTIARPVTCCDCRDSDGGIELNIRGIVEDISRKVYEDICTSSSMLQEGFCGANERLKTSHHYCELGCYAGRCRDGSESLVNFSGAAREPWQTGLNKPTQTTTTTTLTPPGIRCNDTDRGFNTSVKGDILINGRKKWGDSCISGSQLQEGYCDDNKILYRSTRTVYCELGCLDGACIQEEPTYEDLPENIRTVVRKRVKLGLDPFV